MPTPGRIFATSDLHVGHAANRHLVEEYRGEQKGAQIESQLAAAIYLMVGSLRAGASLLAAFDSALEEVGPPLRPCLMLLFFCQPQDTRAPG